MIRLAYQAVPPTFYNNIAPMPLLNACVRKSFDLPDFNQTHKMFLSKCKTFALQVGYVLPSLAGHYFRVNTG